jgi:myo-inositol 2-dehydrogenase / D-chiro-inositol 1-dehydrogenase
MSKQMLTRREMLGVVGKTGLALGFPAIIPSGVLGKNAPSNRITIGMIGMGRQSLNVNLSPFLKSDDARVVAVCDVDRWRLDNARAAVDKHYGNTDCKAYADWREIVARKDIDAIMNSTPDHWHVPISLAAVRGGKHVSCEKPLTLSIAEGRVLADAVKKQGVVFRTDSECRSHPNMHKAAELARNGYLGALRRVKVLVPPDFSGGKSRPMPVPEELNYDMWVGPAKMLEYTADRVHPQKAYDRPGWMRCRNTCEGMIANWGTHLLDVMQLANNSERSGPSEVEGTGQYPAPDSGLWDVLIGFEAHYRYPGGLTVEFCMNKKDEAILRMEGDEGWIEVNWFGKIGLTASQESILSAPLKETDVRLPQRQDKEDFLYGIKNNAAVMIDAEIGHRTCSMGQIAHIAIQLNRKLRWDPQNEKFDNDAANGMMQRSYREPWGLNIEVSPKTT